TTLRTRAPGAPAGGEGAGRDASARMIHYSWMWRIPAVLFGSLLLGWASARAADGVVAETLDNGLRVLLLEDHRSPIVSFQVWYRVGSRNEARGATGIAHFLEHMMFKGTPTHGRGQFARLVEQNGGQDNAFTSQDVTAYFVDIVADKLDLVLELDADRMQNLLLDPKQIDSERQVVLEEWRTRTEDDPGGFLGEEVAALAFKAHPYGFPIIGWREDIARITPEEIRAFYTTYYVPNNALVVAGGDFRPAATTPTSRWTRTSSGSGRRRCRGRRRRRWRRSSAPRWSASRRSRSPTRSSSARRTRSRRRSCSVRTRSTAARRSWRASR